MIKKLIKTGPGIIAIGVYGTLIIEIFQNLFLLPLYISAFGKELYGEWLATGGIVGILAFADIGISSITIQKTAVVLRNNNRIEIFKVLGTSLSIILLFLLLLSFALYQGAHSIIGFIDINADNIEIITLSFKLSLIGTALSLVNNVLDGFLCTIKREYSAKSNQIIGAVFGFFYLLFSIYQNPTILIIPIAVILRYIITSVLNCRKVISEFYAVRSNNQNVYLFSKELAKEYISIIPHLFLSKLITTVNNGVESVFITKYVNPATTAMLVINKKIASFIRSILDRVGGILYPYMSKSINGKLDKNSLSLILKTVIILSSIIFFASTIFNQSIIELWMGNEFFISQMNTYLIILSLWYGFLSNFLNYILSSTGKFKISSNINSINSILILLGTFFALKYSRSINLMLFVQSFIFQLFIFINLTLWKNLINFKDILITYFWSALMINLVFAINLLVLNDQQYFVYSKILEGSVFLFLLFNLKSIVFKLRSKW